LRAARRTAVVLALSAVVIVGTGVSAHRQDEYLQAARLAVEPGVVELELDLTPGIAVADEIIAEIDRDRDGFLTADEKRIYVQRVLGAINLYIDGQPLQTEPMASTFPVLDALRHGDGTIRLRVAAVLPRLSSGDHQLLFRNTHRPEVSAYLANALVPESHSIAITAQRRDGEQHDLTIDFVLRTEPATDARVWLLIAIASVALLMALVARGPLHARSHEILWRRCV
jgi:hypothetical protein